MRNQAKFSVLAKTQRRSATVLASVMAGLSIATLLCTANAAISAQSATQPPLSGS